MAKAQEKTTSVTVHEETGLPASLEELALEDAGKGVSTRQEDNLVPMIYVLQALSPQVDDGNPARIPGAKAGDIWLRNTSEPIADGKEGIWFQPCYYARDFVEWVPRDQGGGFVTRHPELPAEAQKVEDAKNPNRQSYRMPNGNQIVETRYHMGFVHNRGPVPLPFVIPLSSTGHQFSRAWMFMYNQKRLKNGSPSPSWAYIYHLRTIQKTNSKGRWYMFEAMEDMPIRTEADYLRGRQLHEAFASGAREAEAPVHDQADLAEEVGL